MANKYKDHMFIDHNALDVEWIEQADKYNAMAELLANAELLEDKKKGDLEVIEAKCSNHIRQHASEYGLKPSPTDSQVKMATRLHPRYQVALDEYHKAKYEAKLLTGAVYALKQRKEALEHLCYLWSHSYFAGPKMPRNLNYEVEKKQRTLRVNDKIRQHHNQGRNEDER